MNYEELRQIILEIEELKLKAQLRAVREAMKSNNRAESPQKPTRISQTEYVYQLLKEERSPLHIKDIIEKCRSKYDIVLQRETIVFPSAKKDR